MRIEEQDIVGLVQHGSRRNQPLVLLMHLPEDVGATIGAKVGPHPRAEVCAREQAEVRIVAWPMELDASQGTADVPAAITMADCRGEGKRRLRYWRREAKAATETGNVYSPISSRHV